MIFVFIFVFILFSILQIFFSEHVPFMNGEKRT